MTLLRFCLIPTLVASVSLGCKTVRIALDDPMLMGMIAPQSVGANTTETAYALQLNQKLPWFGKRRLRGDIAAADADAALSDVEDTRLQVRLTADLAFYEYFLATRL